MAGRLLEMKKRVYWFECKLPHEGMLSMGVEAYNVMLAVRELEKMGATKIWYHKNSEQLENEESRKVDN